MTPPKSKSKLQNNSIHQQSLQTYKKHKLTPEELCLIRKLINHQKHSIDNSISLTSFTIFEKQINHLEWLFDHAEDYFMVLYVKQKRLRRDNRSRAEKGKDLTYNGLGNVSSGKPNEESPGGKGRA